MMLYEVWYVMVLDCSEWTFLSRRIWAM